MFAASNAASLLALLAYPLAVEPALEVPAQFRLWSAAYGVFVALACGSALLARRGHAIPRAPDAQPWRTRLLWIALAATPSALWLAVANQASQSVAPVPLLWILPLSLYLLSLILCFHRDAWYRPSVFRWAVPVAVAGLCAAIRQHSWSDRVHWGLLLYFGGLFAGCMFCHGELARRRPPAADLTGFYLAVALGGAIGGAFVSLLAPALFNDYLELPAAIVACILLALPLLYGYSSKRHLVRLAAVGAAVFLVSTPFTGGSRLKERNFYGVLEVRDHASGDNSWRGLYNGTILHGSQFLSPERSREATTYYSPWSGVGLELQKTPNRHRRVGIIGLGPGTLAAYAGEGDYFRFYEINPLVIQIAATEFRFLRECRGEVEVVTGDARLALDRESPRNFDLLAVDAFSGDAIPVHLLTREAFETYLRHLSPSGVLAVHVSGKYFDLAPLVVRTAQSIGREAHVVKNDSNAGRQIASSTWVILDSARRSAKQARVWTDRYSNLLEVVK
jgi:SAM-dependent methyltransferase